MYSLYGSLHDTMSFKFLNKAIYNITRWYCRKTLTFLQFQITIKLVLLLQRLHIWAKNQSVICFHYVLHQTNNVGMISNIFSDWMIAVHCSNFNFRDVCIVGRLYDMYLRITSLICFGTIQPLHIYFSNKIAIHIPLYQVLVLLWYDVHSFFLISCWGIFLILYSLTVVFA